MPRLGGGARVEGGDGRLVGAALGGGQGCRDRPLGPCDHSQLVDGHVLVGARHIAPGDVEQRVEQGGAQQRRVVGHRVAQPQGGPPGVVGLHPLAVEGVRHEGVGLDLDHARLRQRSGGAAAGALGGGEAPARGRRGHDHGDVVVAVQARDLLDQPGGVHQVGAPRRRNHRHHPVGGAVHGAAHRLQELDDALHGVGDARQALRLPHGEGDRGGGGRLVDVRDGGVDGPPAVAGQQLGGALGGDRGQARVRPALEALGRLRVQPVAPGAARHRHRVEVRRLEEHVRGGGADLGVLAAHDAGDADDARALAVGGVRDQKILGVQGALLGVQGHQRLPVAGPAHHDGGREVAQVVGVHRLAQVQHHVVRDVDRQGQRAHARRLEALDHPPRGRGRRIHAAHHARHEAVHALLPAHGRVVGEDHGEPVGGGRGGLGGDHAGKARITEGGAR